MEYNHNYELYHHGVKGMKWGVRKKTDSNVASARAAYKTAKKEYNKSFNRANNRAFAAYSPIKKHRQANDARWEDAFNKAEALNKAKAEYKSAKKTAKQNSSNPNRAREVAIGVGAAAGTALAAYGMYKVSTAIKNKNFKRSMDRGMKCAKKLAERGQFDLALSNINDVYSHHGDSVGSIIKRTIANNEVNGKVDWRNVAKNLI